MTREQLTQIMQRNCIVDGELDDVISFVNELLEFQAKELEETEPYATRTIRELECAANHVWNLQDYIAELEE